VVETIFEIIGSWLQHGSDKGLLGKIRYWLLVILVTAFGLAMAYAYFVNLPTMSLALAIGLPVIAALFGGVYIIFLYAVRQKAKEEPDELD